MDRQHTPAETALLIALLLKRSGQERARISTETLRNVSARRHIRGAFVHLLIEHLKYLGLILIEIDRGGYALIPSSALHAAPAISARKYLLDDLDRLHQGNMDFDDIRAELETDVEVDGNDRRRPTQAPLISAHI
jgi:hypothetical protein